MLFSKCIDAGSRAALARTAVRLGGAVAPDGDEDFTHFVTARPGASPTQLPYPRRARRARAACSKHAGPLGQAPLHLSACGRLSVTRRRLREAAERSSRAGVGAVAAVSCIV